MPTISISGLGSGIDFNAVRDAIINQRAIPITQLQTRANKYTSRTDSLKELNALLAALTTATKDLTRTDVGTGRSATAADTSVATLTASSSANLGNLNLNVTRLATSLTQASRSYSSVDAPILAGGSTSATFELRLGGATSGTPITINSSNNSLAGLRDAINAENAGVTASIIDLNGDGTQQQIVLSSKETGAAGRVELVETSATGTAADLTFRSLNPPDGDFAKLDAAFSINGLDLTRSTNNISDAVSGLNISLKKVGSTSIEVTESTEIEDKLTALVTAYNAIQDFIAAQYKKDGQNRPSGVLVGDSALRNVQKQISTIARITSEDNGGALSSLTQIGITTDKAGRLEFDKDELKEQLQTNSADVRALLYGRTTAERGIFQSAFDVSNGLSDNIIGSVQTAITGYESSVKNLNDSIARRTALLNTMRDTLTRQFAAADAAIGQLNGQGTALSGFLSSLTRQNNS